MIFKIAITEFLNKQLGPLIPINKRKYWRDEFTGLTIKQWLIIPIRIILLLPLRFAYFIFQNLADYTDNIYDYLDAKLR